MKLIELFVRRPVVALVVNLVILVIGLQAARQLSVQQFPTIEQSSLVITTAYVGGSAETVRGFISTPIERAVSSVAGVDYVESSSVAGMSTVTVRLELNHPAAEALAEVGNRLDQIRSELPEEAEPPRVEIQRADRPYASFYVSVISTVLDRAQLTEYLTREVQPRLATLPGVQRIGLEGARPRAIRIWLDAAKLAAFDLGAEDLERALLRNNVIATVGRAEGESVQVDLRADTDLRTAAEFERLIVRASDEGGLVRLGDVARVELAAEEPADWVRYGPVDAIYLSVWPLPGANELTVGAALKEALAEIEPSLPAGTRVDIGYDVTVYMGAALTEITKTLAETVAIVALIVFLFLGSVRTALVPLVAIPVSLIGAIGAMLAMGFSLNLLTLLAIVLAVGLVVDDAIVVVENVARLMREGKSRLRAALLSARELFGPVVAMTITLATVYAPIGLLGGLTGVLFREFAFTLAVAVIMSGVVAVTLSPVMSSWVAPAGGREGRFTRAIGHAFDRLARWYDGVLGAVLMHRAQVLTFGAVLTVLIVPLYLFSGKELAPVEDQGDISTIVTSAPDATLEYTAGQMLDVVATGDALPEYYSMWQVVTATQAFGGLIMDDWGERARTTPDLLPQMFGALNAIPGVQVFPVLSPALPGAGNFDVELVIRGSAPPEVMAGYAQQLVGRAFASGRFYFADTDLKIDLPQVVLAVDRERVADLGLDLADVGRQLGLLLAGNYVNRFDLDGRANKVVPQVEGATRASAEGLLDVKIRTPEGALVPLSSLVRIETTAVPRALTRFQQTDSFRVFGGLIPGTTKDDGLAILEQAAREILPPSFALDYAGESRQIRQEGATLLGTLAFAVVLIYLVLAAQFGSFRDPLVVLLGSVPLALSGALIFPFLDVTTVNIYTQVGLITLVGLIAKNGILIVEFANRLQEEGASKLAAIRGAARQRLRPVLMTTAATVFGHLPLILVSGPGAAARNAIGIVLVAGMTIGTIFTLFVLPAVYLTLASRHRAEQPDEEAGVANDDPDGLTAGSGRPALAAE